MSAPVISVEDGLGATAAREAHTAHDALAAPPEARTSRFSARWLSALVPLQAVALSLLVLAALSSSFQRAYDIRGRVTRLHAVAPESAESATLLFDVDLEPRRWSPHRVTLHGGKCRVRAHGLDVLADVREIHYVGPTRVRFPARVQSAPAGELEAEPECEFQSSLDLFGSGVVVPRTVRPSLAGAAWFAATPRPEVWMERVGPPTLGGARNSSLSLEQTVNVSVQVPAGSLPQFLHDLLGSALISVEGAVAYSEEEDGSVRITKAVSSSLVAESDGRGGFLLSLPVNISGHVLPAAFASTAARAAWGRSRPREGAPLAEDGSIDRSMRLVAEVPRSPIAQCLGSSHVVGWRSQQGSVVNEMVREARRRLGRQLARSVVGSAGKHGLELPLMHDLELPPMGDQGRRLGLLDSGRVTFRETFYYDTYRTDMQWTAVIKEDSVDFAFEMAEDRETFLTVQLDVSDSEDASSVVFDMTWEGTHLGTVDITNSDEPDLSLNAHFRNVYTGYPIIDLAASSVHDQGDHLTVRLYDSNSFANFEFATLEYVDTTSEFRLDLALHLPTAPAHVVLTAAVEGFRDGDLTGSSFAIAAYDYDGQQALVLNGSTEDAYGQVDGFSVNAILELEPGAVDTLQSILSLLPDYWQALSLSFYYDRRLSDGLQGTFLVAVEGTHADDQLDASALLEAIDPAVLNYTVPVLALSPLVLTTRAEQFSIETTVLDSIEAIVANVSLYLTNEPPGMEQQAIQIDSFDLEVAVSVADSGHRPDDDVAYVPCLQGSCALTAKLHDRVLDVDFESSFGRLTGYSGALDVRASDAEVSADVDLFILGETYWGFVALNNSGSSIARDQFDLESAGGHRRGPDAPFSWHLVLDREPSSFVLDGRIFETVDEVVSIGVSVVELDTVTTSFGHLFYDDITFMKWEAELAEDVAAGMEAFTMTYFDSFSGDVSSSPLFNMSVVCLNEESTGTFTLTVEASDREGYLDPFGSLVFQRLDSEQSASIVASVRNLDNEAFGSFSADIDFTSAPPSRLLSDWAAGVNFLVTNLYNISDVIYSGSLAATSSGGSFSSEMSVTGGAGATIESWSLTGTSSAERIDASGELSESGSTVAIAFSKPGGLLNEFGAMAADIAVEIGTPVIQVNLDYDGKMQFQASAEVADGESPIFSGAATLHEKWVSLVSHSHFEQDLFEMGLNSVYEYFNMSIFAVEISEGVCELWQDSFVQTYNMIETANISVRFSTDDGEVTDFSVLAHILNRDRMTGEWTPAMNLSLSSGQIMATSRIEGSFAVDVDAATAVDFAQDARVITAFERVVAGKAGVSIADVDVYLSAASDQSRRLSSTSQTMILVSYAISVHITVEEGSEARGQQAALDIPRAMREVTAERFAADFNDELEVFGEDVARLYLVEPVSGSAAPPQVPTTTTLTTTTVTQDSDAATTAMSGAPAMSTSSGRGGNDGEDIGDTSSALPAANALVAISTGLLGVVLTL